MPESRLFSLPPTHTWGSACWHVLGITAGYLGTTPVAIADGQDLGCVVRYGTTGSVFRRSELCENLCAGLHTCLLTHTSFHTNYFMFSCGISSVLSAILCF